MPPPPIDIPDEVMILSSPTFTALLFTMFVTATYLKFTITYFDVSLEVELQWLYQFLLIWHKKSNYPGQVLH
jgi:hypothetical protein